VIRRVKKSLAAAFHSFPSSAEDYYYSSFPHYNCIAARRWQNMLSLRLEI